QKKQRKQYTPEEKLAIVRQQLLEKEPISKVCDDVGLRRQSSTVGRRNCSRTGLLPSTATGHLGQRPTVHCQRLQGIHSGLGHDARQNFALLSLIERKIERWHRSLKRECIRPGS